MPKGVRKVKEAEVLPEVTEPITQPIKEIIRKDVLCNGLMGALRVNLCPDYKKCSKYRVNGEDVIYKDGDIEKSWYDLGTGKCLR
jgi:hypothetical protein